MKNLFWLLAFAALPLTGADYYLDNVKGNDANDGTSGAPMATFKALESKLKPRSLLMCPENSPRPTWSSSIRRPL